MTRLRVKWLCLLFLMPLYFFAHQASWQQRAEVHRELPAGYLVPSQFSRVLSCGFKGLLSDFQFLRILSFYGDRSINHQTLKDEDWTYFFDSIDVITDLDPWFYDPYVLTEGLLVWEAGRVDLANKLLSKGIKYRNGDWRLPYFVGFNYFFFLKDYAAGAEYIMKAAQLPGSPNYLPTLAARLAYYGDKSETALLFLRQMLQQNIDERLAYRLRKRLLALESAVLIEDALELFRREQKREVIALEELVSFGYLQEVPDDPYGGEWYMLESGRVFSTSKFVEKKKGL